MQDDAQPKFRRRANARPDEVLDAALDLFIEQGFATTKVEQIARRAGLSKGAVYLYFPSKQAIMLAIVRRALRPVADRAMANATQIGGDPRQAISATLRMLASGVISPKLLAIPKLIVREAAQFPELAAMYRAEVLDQIIPAMRLLITRAIETGQFRPVDPDLTLRSLIGPVLAHMLLADVFGIVPEGGLSIERLVENHLTILFDGLSLPGKGSTP